MLIPAIDLMGGAVVQLVQGERVALRFDDVDAWAERFAGLSARAGHRPRRRQGPRRQPRSRGPSGARLPARWAAETVRAAAAEAMLDADALRVIVGMALYTGALTTEA